MSCADVGKVRGYSRPLTATVTDGVLHAEDKDTNKSNWLTIDGVIPKGGKATLNAKGLTGNSAYAVGGVKPGSVYSYSIDAQFEATHGSGKRNELRPCTVEFVKR